MTRQKIYYLIIALNVTVVSVAGAMYAFSGVDSPKERPLDPPQVVVQRLKTAEKKAARVKAARDLIRHGERARVEIRSAVREHQHDDPEVLAPLVQATMKTRDHRSMPTLIELLEHPDPLVRGRAGAAIQKILGADFGYRANDPPQQRAKIVELIKQDYQNAQDRIREFYGDQTR